MEQLIVKLNTPAAIGETSILEIDFFGALHDKIVGFYQSNYQDPGKGPR